MTSFKKLSSCLITSVCRLNAARASVCVCPLIFKTKLFILIFNSYGVTRAFSAAFYSVIFKASTDKTPYLGRRHDGEVHTFSAAMSTNTSPKQTA